ncbi:hypothetical protein M902_0689 [Bacteriovorax sp. BAL6_X]|uniref:hypothetical protein n=1 Tax=Bacteriovorax sp. BAL6_X TaxID=1201290 RepID=UPI000386A4E6|nr:hypothetical protein [Bacteriovorax sp. BAL6_X]EPZ49633.1 hypothetical protein M902_0689 [Bacteriovorax sp. BAL6_X]
MSTIGISKKLVILSLMAVASHATLPDEIDYQKYSKLYDNSKTQSQSAKIKVEELKSEVLKMTEMLEVNTQDLELTMKIVADATAMIDELSGESEILEVNLSELVREQGQIEEILASVKKELSEGRVIVNNNEAMLASLKKSVEVEQSILKEVMTELESNKTLSKENEDKLISLKARVTLLGKQTENKAVEVKSLTKDYSSILKEVSANKKKLGLVVPKVRPLELEMEKLDTYIVRKREIYRAAKLRAEDINIEYNEQTSSIRPLLRKRDTILSNISVEKKEYAKSHVALIKYQEVMDSIKVEASAYKAEMERIDADQSIKKHELEKIEIDLLQLGDNQTSERRILLAKKLEVEGEIKVLDDEYDVIKSKLSVVEYKIKDGGLKLMHLGKQYESAEKKLRYQESLLVAVDKRIIRAAPKFKQLEASLEEARLELKRSQDDLGVSIAEYEEVKHQLRLVNGEIEALNEEKDTLRKKELLAKDKLRVVQVSLKELKEDHLNTQNKLVETEVNSGKLARNHTTLEAKRDLQQKKIAGINDKIFETQKMSQDALKRSEELNIIASTKEKRMSELVDEVLTTRSRLRTNTAAIVENQAELNAGLELIDKLEKENAELTLRRTNAEDTLIISEARANELEQTTQDARIQYETRQNLYNEYVSESKVLGQVDAITDGASIGSETASADAMADANKYGGMNGQNVGALDSYLVGLSEGLEQGKTDGYNQGVNSQEDYDLGHEEGYAIGLQNAKNIAMEEDFHAAFTQAKELKMSVLPNDHVVLTNKVQEREFFMSTSELLNFVSFEEDGHSDDVPFNLGDSKETYEEEVVRIENQIEALTSNIEEIKGSAEYVYTAPTKITEGKAKLRCQSVYKQVSELRAICEDSYHEIYGQEFLASHRKVYFEEYDQLFVDAREEARTNDHAEAHKQGLDRGHRYGFGDAMIEGQRVAFENGKKDGAALAQDENLGTLREQMAIEGKEKGTTLFEDHAVVRIDKSRGAILTSGDPRGLAQDSNFGVGLGLVNFGKVASEKGVISAKVISTSDNIEVFDKKVNLAELPAESKIDLKDVIFAKITNNAKPGSIVSMDIELTYPGDSLKDKYTEVTTFKSVVLPNPDIRYAVAFDETVEYGKCWLVCKYKSHDIKFQLKGVRDNIPGEFQVKLDVLEGGKYLELNETIAKMPVPGQGKIESGKFSYKFKEKAAGKELKFKMDVLYKGSVLHTKVFNVKVK